MLKRPESRRTTDPGPADLSDDQRLPALVLVAVAAITVAYALTGFPFDVDFSEVWERGIRPDALHEVVTAREALSGDPYRPLEEIMPEYGLSANGYAGVSPRPPAALLLQTPLLLAPRGHLGVIVTSVIVVLLVVIVMLSAGSSVLTWRQVMWISPLLFISFPVVTALTYGSVSAVAVVALIVFAWRFRRPRSAGAAIGVAAAWRLWPSILILALWIGGRRRAAALAAVIFVGLNAGALLLPGVSVEGSFGSLMEGASDWMNHNLNVSLAAVLDPLALSTIVVTSGMAAVGIVLMVRHSRAAFEIGTISALIASPLSWPSYSLAALPVAFHWLARERSFPLAATTLSPALLWFVVPSEWRGRVLLLSLLIGLISAIRLSTHEPGEPTGPAQD